MTDKLIKSARRFTSRGEWRRKDNAAYQMALKMGIHGQCVSHMTEGYYKKVSSLSQTDAAYLAGIIDREGCLTASRWKGVTKSVVQVGSTSHVIVDFVKNKTGVGSYVKKKQRSSDDDD